MTRRSRRGLTSFAQIDIERQQTRDRRWRRWLPIVHRTGTLAAIVVGIGAFITTPMLLVLSGWHALFSLSHHNPEMILILPLAAPPTVAQTLLLSLEIAGYAMATVGMLHYFSSAIGRVNHLLRVKGASKPLSKHHPAQEYVTGLCKEHRIRPAKVHVIYTDKIMAFAASAPLRRPVVMISSGLLERAPLEVSRWVMAHEVAHIYFGDTKRNALWMVAINTLLISERLRVRVTNLGLRIISFVPVLRRLLIPLLGRPLVWLSKALSIISLLGYRVAVWVYRLFDRWVSRQCEYRADQFAATQEGIEPGIRLLEALTTHFEPQLNIMATHPLPKQRADALRLLASEPELYKVKPRPLNTSTQKENHS